MLAEIGSANTPPVEPENPPPMAGKQLTSHSRAIGLIKYVLDKSQYQYLHQETVAGHDKRIC